MFERLEQTRRTFITAIRRNCRRRGLGVFFRLLVLAGTAVSVVLTLWLLVRSFLLGDILLRVLGILMLVLTAALLYVSKYCRLTESKKLLEHLEQNSVLMIPAGFQPYVCEVATNVRVWLFLVESNCFVRIDPFNDEQEKVRRYLLFREPNCQYMVINQQNFRPQQVDKLVVDIPVFGGLRVEAEIVDRTLRDPGRRITQDGEQRLAFDMIEHLQDYCENTELVSRQLVAYLLDQLQMDAIESCINRPMQEVYHDLMDVDLQDREQVLSIISGVSQRVTLANTKTDLLQEIRRQFYNNGSYCVEVEYGIFVYKLSFNNANSVYFNNEENILQSIRTTQETLDELLKIFAGNFYGSPSTKARALYQQLWNDSPYREIYQTPNRLKNPVQRYIGAGRYLLNGSPCSTEQIYSLFAQDMSTVGIGERDFSQQIFERWLMATRNVKRIAGS